MIAEMIAEEGRAVHYLTGGMKAWSEHLEPDESWKLERWRRDIPVCSDWKRLPVVHDYFER